MSSRDRFPLNEIQRAYLVGGSLELGEVPPRYYVEADADGLDLARLQQALDRLVARHEALRSVFHADGTQEVLPAPGPLPIACTDLRSTGPVERAATLERARAAALDRRTPPGSWPSVHVSAHLLPAGITRLALGIDLLVLDATSMMRFNAELTALYDDPETALEPVSLALSAYRGAEVETAAAARAARALAPPVELAPAPELPMARPPATVRGGHRFTAVRDTLSPDEWARLAAVAAGERLTPGALLTAASAWTLGGWTKAPRFALGLTTHGRLPVGAKCDALLGPFTGLAAVDVDVAGHADPLSLARQLQGATWRAARDARHGGVGRLAEVAMRRGARGAVTPVVMTTVLGGARGTELLGGLASPVFSVMQTPQVWLEHQVLETADGLVLQHNAVEGLFCDGVVEDLLAAEVALLRRLAAGGRGGPRSALLPPAQVARRAEANATDEPLPTGTLHAPVVACASADPQAIAVITPSRRLTYGELVERARSLADVLRTHGAAPEQLVAVVAPKGWEQVVAVLAVHLAGAAYLPVEPALPDARKRELLELGEVRIAITTSAVDEVTDWPDGLVRLGVDVPRPRTPELSPVARPEHLAYVIPTSGSTGTPKGVMIEHAAARNTVQDVNARLALGPGDAVLGLSSLSFDLSVWDVFGVLGAGATLVLPDAARAADPAHWLDLVEAHGVTVWNSVPALARMLVEHCRARGAERRAASLRAVLMSGDWIPVGLPDELRRTAGDVEVVSMGGATEAAIWSIWHDAHEPLPGWTSVPYGRPMANQRWYVLDDELEERPEHAVGHLHIAGTGLARGYWRDPEKTAAAFYVHPGTGERLYRTGDLGRWRADGLLELLGREDGQVKVQGYRIELSEVELALESHGDVGRAVVRAVGERDGDRRLVGYVTPADGRRPDVGAVRDHAAGRLPSYAVPSRLVVLDALPLTGNGKIDRSALPDVDPRRRRVPQRADASRVAAVLAGVLGMDGVRAEDELSALGVTSLELVRLADALESELGARPELEVLFDVRTVGELAARLGDRTTDDRPYRSLLAVLRPVPEPVLRLVCVPYAGGSGSAFRPWQALLPPEVELLAVQPPGRLPRWGEEPLRSVEALADQLADALADLGDVPYVLLGYSMGALVAYEATRRLEQRGQAGPARLVACAAAAPGTLRPEPVVHLLDDSQLVASLAEFGGVPAGLEDRPEVLRMLLPALRNDLEAVERYRPGAPAPVSCPISAVGGDRDPAVSAEQLGGWSTLTAAGYAEHSVAGGHFFLHDDPALLLDLVLAATEQGVHA